MILPNSTVVVPSPAGHKVKKCSVKCDECTDISIISLQLASSKESHRCRACSNKTRRNLHRVGVPPVNKQIRCVVECQHCNKERYKTRRQLEKTRFTFCDSKCQIRWQRANTNFARGVEAGSYKHGERVDGKIPNYGADFTKELRRRIKIRDGFNCQECKKNFSGKLGKHLDVHHVDENKDNNVDANLICLCKSCHTKLHWVQLNKKRI